MLVFIIIHLVQTYFMNHYYYNSQNIEEKMSKKQSEKLKNEDQEPFIKLLFKESLRLRLWWY